MTEAALQLQDGGIQGREDGRLLFLSVTEAVHNMKSTSRHTHLSFQMLVIVPDQRNQWCSNGDPHSNLQD